MFNILIFRFEETIKQELKAICSDIEHIHVFESDRAAELNQLIQEQSIDCFFFYLDENFDEISYIISALRQKKA